MPDILIVEDDQNQRLLIQEELEEEGYATSGAASGPEALHRVEDRMPDLVVLDLAMPGMDGVELLGRLLYLNQHLPVVIHTAFTQYQDNFMTWAADAYVVKDVGFRELKRTIRQVLEKRGAALGGSSAPATA